MSNPNLKRKIREVSRRHHIGEHIAHALILKVRKKYPHASSEALERLYDEAAREWKNRQVVGIIIDQRGLKPVFQTGTIPKPERPPKTATIKAKKDPDE